MYDNLDSSLPTLLPGPKSSSWRCGWLLPLAALLIVVACSLSDQTSQTLHAQDAPANPAYVDATELIPDTAAGLVRIPNLPEFCTAFDETNAGKLREEKLVKPFFDAQRERLRNYLESVNNKVGVKPDDLYEIASGEVVLAWLPFLNDKRRPYSLCVIADIRDRKPKADAVLETIDQDLKAGGWERTDSKHQGESIRLYSAKRKPGQIKVEQIAICLSQHRIIAADRDTVVSDVLDAVAGQPKGKPISQEPEFSRLLSRTGEAIQAPLQSQGGTLAVQWFARPFAMGRIIRESLEVDRGNEIDIIKLLENQGFAAISSAGGVIALNGTKYDLLHKGVILAKRPFRDAARMMQFDAGPREDIPSWVGPETASFNRLKIKIEEAFWASGSLVDEALGDKIFDDMINDIHKDKNGPQIDIRNNVLPSFDNEVLLLSDNVLPADTASERMLIAIRLNDADKLKTAIQKAMEVEPDANKMETPELKGVDVWQVEQGQGGDDSFDEELFGDLAEFDDLDGKADDAPPLLDKWAIAVVPAGPGSTVPYLMFSSHPELLIATAGRIQTGADDGFATIPEVKKVVESLQDLGVKNPIFDRVVRTQLSLRVKYELLRQNKLRDSSSVLAKLIQRIAEEDADSGEPDPLNSQTLPPIAQIEKYLSDGGSYLEETEDGWETTGFLLK